MKYATELCALAAVISLCCLPAAAPGAEVLADAGAEEARELAEGGDILSLEVLLGKISPQFPGRVIDVELEQEDGRYVYELELVDPDGHVWEMEFDARTAELLDREAEDD